MRESTRRSFLRSSCIVTGGLVAPGVAAASGRNEKQKLRMRGDLSDPLSLSHIHEQKRAIIEDSDAYASDEVVPDVQIQGAANEDKILAYNFDIIGDVPSEWTGIFTKRKAKQKKKKKGKPDKKDDEKERKRKAKRAIENKAEKDADERAKKKRKRKRKDGTGNGKENSVHAGIGALGNGQVGATTGASAATVDWGSWTKQAESDSYITGTDGNDLSWESKWKKDPENNSNQGLNTELTMRPYDQGLHPWDNEYARMEFDFNGSTYDDIGDYGPGNTIGTNTQSFSLAVSSDKTVEVGVSSSTTSSNVDIDNKSDTDADYVKHKYTISGDLVNNTVRINQSAVTEGTDSSDPVTYCNQDLDGHFDAFYEHKTLEQDIKVHWV